MENYHRIDIDFACSKSAEQYILTNICLASDRPQVVLHGDFHWNNCVVDEMGHVGIIDFPETILAIHGMSLGDCYGRWNTVTVSQTGRSTDILAHRRTGSGMSLNYMSHCMRLNI